MDLSDASLRSIVAHIAHLRAEYGDVLAEPDLVEPNGEYFPDEFALDAESVQRLLERMMTYAPLSEDLDVKLGVVTPDAEEAKGGSCSSGGCSSPSMAKAALRPAAETDDGYVAVLHSSDAGDPTVLTASLARSVGRIVLFEADEDVDARDEGPLAELTAVACGLGILLLSGASVYKKGCGGMRQHQATFLSVQELAFALALFVRTAEKKAGTVRRHLEVTQREAFDAALAWVDAQPKLVKTLIEHPETLEDGIFTLEEKKGLFSKLLATKKDDDDLDALPLPRSATAPKSEEERRRIADMKSLVEEALQGRG